jgi:hypothetical protein
MEFLYLIFMLGFIVWIGNDIICLLFKREKPFKKPPATPKDPKELEEAWHKKHGAWKDYGTTTSIMGHEFIRNTLGGYEYNGLVFAANSFTGVNYYWISPGIAITHEEFLTRLDRL